MLVRLVSAVEPFGTNIQRDFTCALAVVVGPEDQQRLKSEDQQRLKSEDQQRLKSEDQQRLRSEDQQRVRSESRTIWDQQRLGRKIHNHSPQHYV